MGKGSGRRPGKGYEDNWERIFAKNEGPALPRREQHAERCAVRDKAYCGGPCTCGLVDPSVYKPFR